MSQVKKPFPAVLAGRCANGNERGQGSVVHAVLITEEDARTQNTPSAAMCGRTQGPRSAGWGVLIGEAITCGKCARMVAELGQVDK